MQGGEVFLGRESLEIALCRIRDGDQMRLPGEAFPSHSTAKSSWEIVSKVPPDFVTAQTKVRSG